MFGRGAGAKRDSLPEPTPQLLACLEVIKLELLKYTKEVWKMQLTDYQALFELFNKLEQTKGHKAEVTVLYEEYFTELMAFFQSGRPELVEFANIEKLHKIKDSLHLSQEISGKKDRYDLMIPTLSKTLILMGDKNRLTGIRLLNSHCRRVYNFDYSKEADRLKAWLNNNEVYSEILTKGIDEAEFEESKHILKFFGKSMNGEEKTSQILKLLAENKDHNKWLSKFCFKQLEVYSMSNSEKELLVEYLKKQEDLPFNYPEYAECLDDLAFRLDYS
jgi:hypothetical protein